jgi:hypothetical protein
VCKTYIVLAMEPNTTFYEYFLFVLGYIQFFPAFVGLRQMDKVVD